MNPPSDELRETLAQAHAALKHGNRSAARRWATRAIMLAPEREEPWLLMSTLASPRASAAYLKRALEINPQSQRARQHMHWAVRRLRATRHAQTVTTQTGDTLPMRPAVVVRRRRPLMAYWAIVVLVLLLGIAAWVSLPPSLAAAGQEGLAGLNLISQAETLPPLTPAFLDSPTPSSTATPTETQTPLPTFTTLPSDTPQPTQPPPTETLLPTDTPLPTDLPIPTDIPPTAVSSWDPTNPDTVVLPPGVGMAERWIDVDLTNQRLYAFEGQLLVNAFTISSGTWYTPTVTGQYQIYIKYETATMFGPGYYLPDVPYVMYFFGDYGLHGTYWHDNFGTPMSHGCVNLRTEDAGWLFDWANVGTTVYIHY